MKSHSSTERFIKIIETLAHCKSASIEEISSATSIPYTTIYRVIQTCVNLGYIMHHDKKKFKLTQKFFLIISAYLHEHHSIAETAHPFLQRLSYSIKETIHLGILADNKVLYIDKIETRYKIRMHSYIGFQASIHCTALGKAICAFLPLEEQKEIVETINFEVYTHYTIKSKTKLLSEFHTVASQGYAEDNQGHEIGLYCIAVPIFNQYQQAVAALSTSTLLFRFDMSEKMKTIKLLWNSAEEISKQLGNTHYRIWDT